MTPYYLILLLPILLAGCSGSKVDAGPSTHSGGQNNRGEHKNTPTALDVARTYRDLRLMTAEPVLVDPHLAELCVGIWKRHVDDARMRSGPHAHTAIRIFMNDVAALAFGELATGYPVGSIIVKEKQGLEYNDQQTSPLGTSKTSNGVGGMIKRPPGYDPEHGDWEYFYFDDASNVEHGKILSCVQCHHLAVASDHVFGNWAD